MRTQDINNILFESNLFKVKDVQYKHEEDFVKYGTSFEAKAHAEYEMLLINHVKCKAHRVIEEFGYLVAIYNGEQVSIPMEKIECFKVLDIRGANLPDTGEVEVYHF